MQPQMPLSSLPPTRRELILTAAKYLNSVKDRDPSVQAVLKLLALLREESIERLLRANPNTFAAFQGEVKAIDAVQELIETKPPPPIEDN